MLWRGPTSLQDRVRRNAAANDLTLNAYLTGAMIFAFVLYEADGPTLIAIARLTRAIVEAAERARNVLGACDPGDWECVERFMTTLLKAGVITAPETRRDDRSVLYTFGFTRIGTEIWTALGRRLLLAFEAMATS